MSLLIALDKLPDAPYRRDSSYETPPCDSPQNFAERLIGTGHRQCNAEYKELTNLNQTRKRIDGKRDGQQCEQKEEAQGQLDGRKSSPLSGSKQQNNG